MKFDGKQNGEYSQQHRLNSNRKGLRHGPIDASVQQGFDVVGMYKYAAHFTGGSVICVDKRSSVKAKDVPGSSYNYDLV